MKDICVFLRKCCPLGKRRFILAALLVNIVGGSFFSFPALNSSPQPSGETPDYYKPYLKLLKEVYTLMDKNYYKPVSEKVYKAFVEKYKQCVLSKLREKKKMINKIAYIGAGLLVNRLRDPEDTFTNFIPPKKAKKYSQKVYGYENGIGISGYLTGKGYVIDHVQIRSDAYQKGIKSGDIILKIDDHPVTSLTKKEIKGYLYPPLGTTVKLEIFSPIKKTTSVYKILCKKYFIETIKNIPTGMSGVYYLKIKSFNRKTADDLKDYIRRFGESNIDLLIIDLTDNPGGPPLAVVELSGIFLPPKTKMVYYEKKNIPKFGLVAPPSDVHYDGALIILVNKKSGSASEILAGIFKAYHRALIMGKSSTAGFAFLKTTFTLENGCMLTMIVGKAYLFNGTPLDRRGVVPDYTISNDVKDIAKYVFDKIKSGELDSWVSRHQ